MRNSIKSCIIFIALILAFHSTITAANSGSMTCPNLEDPSIDLSDWITLGETDGLHSFKQVNLLESGGMSCTYSSQVVLMKLSVIYRPDKPRQPYWHTTGAGINSYYCLESREICSFH